MIQKFQETIYPFITPLLMAVVAFFLREVYTKVDTIAIEIRTLSEDRAVLVQRVTIMERDIIDLENRLRELEQNKTKR